MYLKIRFQIVLILMDNVSGGNKIRLIQVHVTIIWIIKILLICNTCFQYIKVLITTILIYNYLSLSI